MAKKYSDGYIVEVTSRYDVLKEFREKEKKLYAALVGRGEIDKWCVHMKRGGVPPGTYSKERCQQMSLLYKTRTEFAFGSKGEYWAAQRHGWLDEICTHMVPGSNWYRRKIYAFTFSDGYAYVGLSHDPHKRRIQHISEKSSPVFKHIQSTGASHEFRELTDWLSVDIAGETEDNFIREYAADGWKMLNTQAGGSLGGNKKTFYTHERLVAEIAKYDTLIDFRKKSHKYYSYLVREHLVDKYCSNLKRRQTKPRYWTFERSKSVAAQCSSRMELLKKYPGAYNVLYRAGRLDECIQKAVSFPKEIHMARMKECSSRSELYYKYQSTYNWALRNGMLDSFCASKVHYRTYEENLDIIKSCTSRHELMVKYGRVYKWGLKNNLLDEYLPLEPTGLTEEEKIRIISTCKTRGELHDKYRHIHKWAKDNNLLEKYFPVKQCGYADEKKMEVLLGCSSRNEVHDRHRTIFNWAKGNGLLDKYFPK